MCKFADIASFNSVIFWEISQQKASGSFELGAGLYIVHTPMQGYHDGLQCFSKQIPAYLLW